MRLLHLIASPRNDHSRTLQIARTLLDNLIINNPHLEIDELDLSKVTLPPIGSAEAEAKYAAILGLPINETTQASWKEVIAYSEKFKSYDLYTVTCPMWNFSIPYTLKHYIDVIMQPGYLFQFTPTGVAGLLHNKKMVCITSRGNDYNQNGPVYSLDFQEPYLRAIFGLAGIKDITFINAEPLDILPELTNLAMQQAEEKVIALAKNFAVTYPSLESETMDDALV